MSLTATSLFASRARIGPRLSEPPEHQGAAGLTHAAVPPEQEIASHIRVEQRISDQVTSQPEQRRIALAVEHAGCGNLPPLLKRCGPSKMRASADDAEQPLGRLDQLSFSRRALLKPLVPLATFMQAGRPDDVAANTPDIYASV